MEHGRRSVLPGADHRGVQRGHLPDPQGESKNQDAAFTVLTYLLDNQDLLKLYGGMPAVESEQDAFLQSLQADYTQTIDWNVAKAAVDFADVPNFESYVPAYNETFALIQKYGTKWWSTPGLDLDAEIAALKAEMQATWDKSQLADDGPQRRPPPAPGPDSRVWPGDGPAGATSSSRRGSSGSSRSRRSR